MQTSTQKSKRIIRRHLAAESYVDCCLGAIGCLDCIICIIVGIIKAGADLGSPDDLIYYFNPGWIFLSLIVICLIIMVFVPVILNTRESFQSLRQLPKRIADHEHLATATPTELENSISNLQQAKADSKTRLSTLYDEMRQLQSDYNAKLSLIQKQINAERSHLKSAEYDAEINLRQALLGQK